MTERNVISVCVNNGIGVLGRVTGLFSRRGYNIISLNVAETENLGISRNYQLTLQEAGQDSLGTYNLTTTYLGTKDGNQAFTDSGTVVTIIGIPNDSTAIVYQLVSATPGHEKTNFLAEGDSALTMIGKDFKKAVSKLNYTLKKKL